MLGWDVSGCYYVFTNHLFHTATIQRGVGCGGALAESMTFNRRVVGSTPALAATCM